jgi:hypothetical protein
LLEKEAQGKQALRAVAFFCLWLPAQKLAALLIPEKHYLVIVN